MELIGENDPEMDDIIHRVNPTFHVNSDLGANYASVLPPSSPLLRYPSWPNTTFSAGCHRQETRIWPWLPCTAGG